MNADEVRALVAAKWPEALQSPVAVACVAFAVADDASRAIEFADLHARVTQAAERRQLLADAIAHAESCLNACDGWSVETLGHNIESAMSGDLDEAECDEIARKALGING